MAPQPYVSLAASEILMLAISPSSSAGSWQYRKALPVCHGIESIDIYIQLLCIISFILRLLVNHSIRFTQTFLQSRLPNPTLSNPSINMKTTTLTLASLSALSHLALADYGWHFGNAFSTGPVATNSFIRESNTTLVLPKVNSPQTGNLALWPGMGTSGGDLIQALAISVADGSAGCPKASGTWCVVASTLEGEQQMGGFVPASAGAQVTMHCTIVLLRSRLGRAMLTSGRQVQRFDEEVRSNRLAEREGRL